MSDSADLYQQVILDHNRNPSNYGPLPNATHSAEGDNPLCGDRFTIELQVDKSGIITAANFSGVGCAISKASASLMTESVTGISTTAATEVFECFHNLVLGRNAPSESSRLGKLEIFSGIWEYPARVKCAILSWHALSRALSGGGVATTED